MARKGEKLRPPTGWHDSHRQMTAERDDASARYREKVDALAAACDAEVAEAARAIRDKYAALRRETFEGYLVERDSAIAAHDARVEAGGLRP
jgi:hypothetical protein